MSEKSLTKRRWLKKRYIFLGLLGLFTLYLNFYSLTGTPKQDWTSQGELFLENAPSQVDCGLKKFNIYEIWGEKYVFFQSFKNCKFSPLEIEAIMKASGIERLQDKWHLNSYMLYYDHQKLTNYGFIKKCYQEWLSGCWLDYLFSPAHYTIYFTFNGNQITDIKVQIVPNV